MEICFSVYPASGFLTFINACKQLFVQSFARAQRTAVLKGLILAGHCSKWGHMHKTEEEILILRGWADKTLK